MNIISRTPLSMAEARNYIKDFGEEKHLEDYFKAFTKLKEDKAKKLSEAIRALNNPKIKEESVAKIVDFLPQNSEEANKIFSDVSLSEEEANKILEIVKEN